MGFSVGGKQSVTSFKQVEVHHDESDVDAPKTKVKGGNGQAPSVVDDKVNEVDAIGGRGSDNITAEGDAFVSGENPNPYVPPQQLAYPGDGHQPVPDGTRTEGAARGRNHARVALNLFEMNADLDTQLLETHRDKDKDKFADIKEMLKQITERIKKLEEFEAKFEEELAKILQAFGTDQPQMCHDNQQLNQQEQAVADRLQTDLGLTPQEAADLANAIGNGGAPAMAIALVIATALAGADVESETKGKPGEKPLTVDGTGESPETGDDPNAPDNTRDPAAVDGKDQGKDHALLSPDEDSGDAAAGKLHDLAALAHDYNASGDWFWGIDENGPAAQAILNAVLPQGNDAKFSRDDVAYLAIAAEFLGPGAAESFVHQRDEDEKNKAVEEARKVILAMMAAALIKEAIEIIARSAEQAVETTLDPNGKPAQATPDPRVS